MPKYMNLPGMLAASTTTPEGLDSFITSIKGALSSYTVDSLVVILVASIGMTATLSIAWFAYRFITRKVSKALKKGSMG